MQKGQNRRTGPVKPIQRNIAAFGKGDRPLAEFWLHILDVVAAPHPVAQRVTRSVVVFRHNSLLARRRRDQPVIGLGDMPPLA
jgi:hypothetical protein